MSYVRYSQSSLYHRQNFCMIHFDEWCKAVSSTSYVWDKCMVATKYLHVAPLSPYQKYKFQHGYIYSDNRMFTQSTMKVGYEIKHIIDEMLNVEISFLSASIIENFITLCIKNKLSMGCINNLNVQIALLHLFASKSFSNELFIFFHDANCHKQTCLLEDYEYMNKIYLNQKGDG